MYVGNGAVISDEFFPRNENTGLTDPAGETLYTRDIVRIYGCTAKYGVNGSVEWHIDPKTLRQLTKMKTMPEDWE